MNYVIEVLLPDGPHWYGGVKTVEKDGAMISGIIWTPYKEDRMIMNETLSNITFNTVCQNTKGAKILPLESANDKDARVHVGGEQYEIRAKYLSVNLIVIIPGHGETKYVVSNKDEKEFVLRNIDGKNTKVYLGVNSEKRIRVVGERKPGELTTLPTLKSKQ